MDRVGLLFVVRCYLHVCTLVTLDLLGCTVPIYVLRFTVELHRWEKDWENVVICKYCCCYRLR